VCVCVCVCVRVCVCARVRERESVRESAYPSSVPKRTVRRARTTVSRISCDGSTSLHIPNINLRIQKYARSYTTLLGDIRLYSVIYDSGSVSQSREPPCRASPATGPPAWKSQAFREQQSMLRSERSEPGRSANAGHHTQDHIHINR